MMACSRAQQLIQLYLDNQLSLARVRALERHLAHCEACRAEMMLLEDVVEGVHSLAHVGEPTWLTDTIMSRIAAATAQPPVEASAALPGQKQRLARLAPFRLAARDVALSSLLATVAVLSFILAQPTLRTTVGTLANPLFVTVLDALRALFSPDIGVFGLLAWALWVLLGVCITLVVAGSEIRSLWRQRIRDWLPQAWR